MKELAKDRSSSSKGPFYSSYFSFLIELDQHMLVESRRAYVLFLYLVRHLSRSYAVVFYISSAYMKLIT